MHNHRDANPLHCRGAHRQAGRGDGGPARADLRARADRHGNAQRAERGERQLRAGHGVKNASLLEFMRLHEQQRERDRALATLKQDNAGKWRQLQRLQAERAEASTQSAKHQQAEEQATSRRRAHEAAVALVQRRLQLVESLLSGECEALASVVRDRDEVRVAADEEAKAEQKKRKAEATMEAAAEAAAAT